MQPSGRREGDGVDKQLYREETETTDANGCKTTCYVIITAEPEVITSEMTFARLP